MAEKTPGHAKWEREHPDAPSGDGKKLTVQELGTAGHVLILQPDLFDELYVPRPSGHGTSNAYKAAIQRLKADKPFARVTKQDDLDTLKRVRDAVMAHPLLGPLIERVPETELSLLWDDPDTGVRCKGRLDLPFPSVGLGDLKITDDASPEAFGKKAWNFRYDVQGAFYLVGNQVLELGLPSDFFLAVAERQEPFDVTIYEIPDRYLVPAELQLEEWLELYAECEADDEWPGLPPTQELRFPGWADHRIDEFMKLRSVG
jgi:hypothetical protein